MTRQAKGTLSRLVATIIWGSTFVAQSVGMDHIGPFTFQAVRCAMGFVVLIPIIWILDRFQKDGKTFWSRWADPKLWKAGLLCGIPLFIAANLQQMGIVDTDAGKSAFLTAMYIVLVPILGLFRKKMPSIWIVLSLPLAVAGLYCLSCVGVTQISTGDLLLLGCALAFAVQITFVDIYANQVDGVRLNCISCLICAVLSGIVMVFTETPTWESIGGCWFSLVYAGVFSMGIAYTLQIVGQQHLESSTASLLMSMESVFAVLAGSILLHERLTRWEGIGCVLMLAAVVLSQLPNKKEKVSA